MRLNKNTPINLLGKLAFIAKKKKIPQGKQETG
jgi:hypothetical protein